MENLVIKKMSLANIEGKLTVTEMEQIMAGSTSYFCNSLFVFETAWGLGAWANIWNPPGQAAVVGLAIANGYCWLSS
ncbi:MAG: hypothetical protein KA210_05100 [Bacteroidia bacterium]|nr:hypothetical protein [Bacteroidia bacterium]